MTTKIDQAGVERLHGAYIRLTGLAVSLDVAGFRSSLWFEWARHGWNEEELALVVRYVKRCIRDNARGFNVGTLRFNTLIGQTDRFEELLAEARATSRTRCVDPNWAATMRTTGRSDAAPSPPARKVEEILEHGKMAEMLKKFREEQL